jgi:activator of HSP90 ATPase
MTWRTSEFSEDAADSRFEVLLEPAKGGTKVTFRHSDIPEGQGKSYEQGWIDNYFTPMKAYFGG